MMFLEQTAVVTCPYWYDMQPSLNQVRYDGEAAGVRRNAEKDVGTRAHTI